MADADYELTTDYDELVTIISTSSEDEEEPIDYENCDWLMTSKIDTEEVKCNYQTDDSPFESVQVPGKIDFFWNGLNPHEDPLLINARKRPELGNWMCGFCYHWTTTKDELSDHIKSVHIPEARFHICRICGAKYVTDFLLQRHEDTHKYRPTLPSSRYVNFEGIPSVGLIPNHYLNGIIPPLPTKETIQEAGAIFKRIAETKHRCLSCSRTFDEAEELNDHHIDSHTTIYCQLCPKDEPPKVFMRFSDLKEHLIDRHELNYLVYHTLSYSKIWKSIAAEKRYKELGPSLIQFFHSYAAQPQALPPSQNPVIRLMCSETIDVDLLECSSPETQTVRSQQEWSNASSPHQMYSVGSGTYNNNTTQLSTGDESDEINPIGKLQKSNIRAGLLKTKPCKICKKLLPCADYEEHMANHTELKFKCKYDGCTKRFLRNSSLQLHKRAHAVDRAFKCSYCNRGYNYSSLLKRHMRTHTGELPYECDTCGKRFYELVSLSYHKKKIHTLERPYKCNICNKGFILSNDLKKHLEAHGRHMLNGNVLDSSPSRPSEATMTPEIIMLDEYLADDVIDVDDDLHLNLDIIIKEVGLDGAGKQFTITDRDYAEDSG